MTYANLDQSKELGQPVELYLFRYGDDPSAFKAYCDKDTPVVYDGITYAPAPITRGEVVASGNDDKSALTVSVPLDSEIAELFRLYPPTSKVVLLIRGGHYDDPDQEFPVVWAGQTTNCTRGSRDPRVAELTCRPASISRNRTGLRLHYQVPCNNALYDHRCRASKAAATVSSPVSSLEYTSITLPENWFGSFLPEKFITGVVEWDGATGREYRTIVGVSGAESTTLGLTGPTTGLSVGQAVDVVLGCDRQAFGDCKNLHDNIVNFGGCAFMPTENPYEKNPF